MQEVIHKAKNDFAELIVFQEYAEPEPGEKYDQFPTLKTWEGWFAVDADNTEEKVREIMKNSPYEISEYLPAYTGKCIVVGVGGTRPIKVSFKGDGILKRDGKKITKNP